MNRSSLRWLSIPTILLVMIGLSLLGQYLVAIPFLIPLLKELDPIFGKKEESRENRKREVQRQLTEIYQPIHYTIGNLRQHINLGDANGIGFLGGDVSIAELENFDQVRQIFINHGYELRESMVQQWKTHLHTHTRELNPVVQIPLLYVDKELGDLFRELEVKYQKLVKELKELSPDS